MSRQDAYEASISSLQGKVEELERVLEDLLEHFQDHIKGGTTFEGGKDILDVEVSEEMEELLDEAYELLNLEDAPTD